MSSRDFEVITVTSGEQNSGSDATVKVALVYDDKESGSEKVSSFAVLDNPGNDFKRGYYGSYYVTFDNYGVDSNNNIATPKRVRVNHSNGGDWRCHRLYVADKTSGAIFHTTDEFVIEKTEKDFDLSNFVKGQGEENKDEKFKVKIRTADVKNAGTNNAVYIKLISKDGKASENVHLNNVGNDWQKGETFEGDVKIMRPLCEIDTVLLMKDGDQGWFPDQVQVWGSSNSVVKTEGSNTLWVNGTDHGKQNLIEVDLNQATGS